MVGIPTDTRTANSQIQATSAAAWDNLLDKILEEVNWKVSASCKVMRYYAEN
jgi:hypothetical protein